MSAFRGLTTTVDIRSSGTAAQIVEHKWQTNVAEGLSTASQRVDVFSFYKVLHCFKLLGIRCGVSKLGKCCFDHCLYPSVTPIRDVACVCVKIEQQPTIRFIPPKFYVFKFTRPSSCV